MDSSFSDDDQTPEYLPSSGEVMASAPPPPQGQSPPSPDQESPPPKESPPSPSPPSDSPAPPDESPPPTNSPPPPPPSGSGSGSKSPPPNSSVSPPPPESPSQSFSPPPPGSPSHSSSPPPPSSGTPSSPPAPANTTTPPHHVLFPPSAVPAVPDAPGTPTTHPSHGVPAAPNSPASSGSSSNSSPPPSDSSSSNSTVIIAGVVLAGAVLVAFVMVWLVCSKKKKKQPYYPGIPPKGTKVLYNGSQMEHVVKIPPPPGMMGTPLGPGGGWGAPPPQGNPSNEFSSDSGHSHPHIPPASPKIGNLGGFNKSQFSYEELARATSGFSQANLLGQGGFGYVHKGVLPDGREVAVKSLKSGSGQGEREFQAEVEIISRVHHRHLVSLVGYCIADAQRMLVYEFVPNKTLEFHLHGKGQPVMDWGVRLRIALGSARGLAYLHEDCYPKIIHRDIKAANILLDDKYEAMVADFGLAKLSSDNFTHVSTRIMGTFGYLAPEYASSGKLSDKSDVYSFGVMLLELITGNRPVDTTNRHMEDSLVNWARPVLTKALEDGNYDELVDPRLEGNYDTHEMARMIACAAASISHSARRRPKMSQIVRSLEGDSSLEDLSEGAKQSRNGAIGSQSSSLQPQTYNTDMYNADMSKFRKMIMNSQHNSSEFGATSDYGLNPSSSSSDSSDYGTSDHRKPKL